MPVGCPHAQARGDAGECAAGTHDDHVAVRCRAGGAEPLTGVDGIDGVRPLNAAMECHEAGHILLRQSPGCTMYVP